MAIKFGAAIDPVLSKEGKTDKKRFNSIPELQTAFLKG
jgi:hypothetical protein